jgi:polypyrimidine tract-binding protein 2
MVIFFGGAGFQTLIQYQSRQSAIQAYGALHGRNIYDGCCQLDIQYSNLSELQVHYNNDRSRDFTNPSLPTEQRSRSSQVCPQLILFYCYFILSVYFQLLLCGQFDLLC